MSIKINAGIQKVSAMPEVEGSGKVLVSVNGEWVEQEGYGYTEPNSEVVYKIDEKYLPKIEECRWHEDMPLPAEDGYGYYEYYTDNSEEAYLSMADKSINTKYLVLDLSDEDSTKLAWMRQELALNRLNQKSTSYMLKTYTISTSGTSELFLTKSMCDAYETSGKNYYVNTGNYRFYVILDNSLLSQELQNTFPKNGVYFENIRAKGMGTLTGVQCSIRKYHKINPDYIPTSSALYVTASDRYQTVMKITVASDGTITASEA